MAQQFDAETVPEQSLNTEKIKFQDSIVEGSKELITAFEGPGATLLVVILIIIGIVSICGVIGFSANSAALSNCKVLFEKKENKDDDEEKKQEYNNIMQALNIVAAVSFAIVGVSCIVAAILIIKFVIPKE